MFKISIVIRLFTSYLSSFISFSDFSRYSCAITIITVPLVSMHSVHVRQTTVNYLTLVLAATVTKMDWSPINARSANSYFAWFCFPLDFSTTLLAHVFHLFLFLSKTERLSKPLLFTKRGAAGRFLEVHRINWFVFGSVYLFVEIREHKNS